MWHCRYGNSYHYVLHRESHHTVEQAIEYDETLKEQLEKERETFVTKVTPDTWCVTYYNNILNC